MSQQSCRVLRRTLNLLNAFGCCSCGTTHLTHSTLHSTQLHIDTAHNGCGCGCILFVSRAVISLCVVVTAPLVPFVYPGRVGGLSSSCHPGIQSQQQIAAIYLPGIYYEYCLEICSKHEHSAWSHVRSACLARSQSY